MATDKTKVVVPITGAVSVGALGSTAPTDAATALNAAFKDLGGLHPDGVVRKHPEAGDPTVIKFWQNGEQVRVLRQRGEDPMQVTLTVMETTLVAVEAAFDCTVTQAPAYGSYVIDAGKVPTKKAMVLDIVDGSNIERQYFEIVTVASVGDVTYNGEDSVNIELTFDVERSSTLGGHVKVWSSLLKTP